MLSSSSQVFTDAEAARVRDNEPTFSQRPNGVDLPAKMQAILDEMLKVQTGAATVLNATTSIVVAVGAEFDGKLAVVSFAEAPTAATLIWAGPVAAGNLTINIDVDNTADLDVHYVLDGR